jgi:hypothetical protein
MPILAAKKQLDMSHPFFNVPERTGKVDGWNFDKTLRFLHTDREILLFGWFASENYKMQVITKRCMIQLMILYDI